MESAADRIKGAWWSRLNERDSVYDTGFYHLSLPDPLLSITNIIGPYSGKASSGAMYHASIVSIRSPSIPGDFKVMTLQLLPIEILRRNGAALGDQMLNISVQSIFAK